MMLAANFFNNVWAWIQTNLPSVLSGTTLVTALAVICYVVRLVKELRGTTNANTELGKSLKETKALQKSVEEVKTDSAQIIESQEEVIDMVSVLDKEVKALLEVLQLDTNSRKVISDDTRAAINTIITNANYSVTHVRAEIAKQAAEMAEKARKVAEEIAETASKTQKIVKPENENPFKVDFGG